MPRCLLLVALALSSPALASEAPHELRNTSGWFLAGEVVASVGLGFFAPDLFVSAPPDDLGCADAWCGTNGFDVALNKAFLAPNPHLAGTVSHVFTIGLTPALGLTASVGLALVAGEPAYAVQDSVIIVNAFLISTGFNSVAKVGARRQRPAFHYDREADTEAGEHPGEEFVSFYSGDTTWAFALASSASTLAFLRGYQLAPCIALGTGVLALTGSLLRMSADMHWATDVLVGMATGTAVGVGLPLLLHGRKPGGGLALAPLAGPGGAGVELRACW